MPIYEYQCESCEQRTEAIQRLAEPALTICPHCGGPLVKLMSAPSFQFKGSGWYVTDYAGKGDGGKKEAKSGGDESAASSSSAGTEAGNSKAEASDSKARNSETGGGGGGSSSETSASKSSSSTS